MPTSRTAFVRVFVRQEDPNNGNVNGAVNVNVNVYGVQAITGRQEKNLLTTLLEDSSVGEHVASQ